MPAPLPGLVSEESSSLSPALSPQSTAQLQEPKRKGFPLGPRVGGAKRSGSIGADNFSREAFFLLRGVVGPSEPPASDALSTHVQPLLGSRVLPPAGLPESGSFRGSFCSPPTRVIPPSPRQGTPHVAHQPRPSLLSTSFLAQVTIGGGVPATGGGGVAVPTEVYICTETDTQLSGASADYGNYSLPWSQGKSVVHNLPELRRLHLRDADSERRP